MGVVGLLGGFGRSPYSHQMPYILGNLVFVGTMLLGMEVSRAYLMGLLGSRIPLLALLIISLLYTVLSLPAGILLQFGSPQSAIQVIGERILPVLAENLFATFLVFVGGPLASIAYLGTLLAFEWLSPVLPHMRLVCDARCWAPCCPPSDCCFFTTRPCPKLGRMKIQANAAGNRLSPGRSWW